MSEHDAVAATRPSIEVLDVHKSYGSGAETVEALRGIRFDVVAGDFVGLMGPSGSGKTTLLNLLGGLDRPTSGSVRVGGADLGAMTSREISRFRARSIGFVFQSFNLFGVLTAEENVDYPLSLAGLRSAERRRRTREMLERVGVLHKARRRPDELSAGEKQRVAVARALVHRPELVLADEPTANLDSDTGSRIVELLAELNRELKTTFVIATHDAALLGRMHRVLAIRDGRLAGSAEGASARPSVETP